MHKFIASIYFNFDVNIPLELPHKFIASIYFNFDVNIPWELPQYVKTQHNQQIKPSNIFSILYRVLPFAYDKSDIDMVIFV